MVASYNFVLEFITNKFAYVSEIMQHSLGCTTTKNIMYTFENEMKKCALPLKVFFCSIWKRARIYTYSFFYCFFFNSILRYFMVFVAADQSLLHYISHGLKVIIFMWATVFIINFLRNIDVGQQQTKKSTWQFLLKVMVNKSDSICWV